MADELEVSQEMAEVGFSTDHGLSVSQENLEAGFSTQRYVSVSELVVEVGFRLIPGHVFVHGVCFE